MGCGNTGAPSNGQTAEKLAGQLNVDQVKLPTDGRFTIPLVLRLCRNKSKILFSVLRK